MRDNTKMVRADFYPASRIQDPCHPQAARNRTASAAASPLSMAVKCQRLASGSLPDSVTDGAPVRSPFFKGSSTPQAHAEAGGEEDAESHDSDHPHVFGFHRSYSPFTVYDRIR